MRYRCRGHQPCTCPTHGGVTYNWLGAKQRAVQATGLILMGVRLYNPITGQFTSVDPVYSGNATRYTYPQDPINIFDLDGQWGVPQWAKKAAKSVTKNGRSNWKSYLSYAAAGVCVVGSAGACTGLAVVVAGISAYENGRAVVTGRKSVLQGVGSLVYDAVGTRVRAVRGFVPAHRLGNPVVRTRSLGLSLKSQPGRSALRIGYNAGSAAKTYLGW